METSPQHTINVQVIGVSMALNVATHPLIYSGRFIEQACEYHVDHHFVSLNFLGLFLLHFLVQYIFLL